MKKLITMAILLWRATALLAQGPTFAVSDSIPVTVNGLRAGYTITEASIKEVSNKGNFSRYKIKFWVTNVAPEAKIMYRKPGLLNFGTINRTLAVFACSNATGARLTSKGATLDMQPCQLMANVEDKDCANGKTVRSFRPVDIGYWIQPGETANTNVIMIVPLNEKPQAVVTFFPLTGTGVGTFIPDQQQQPAPEGPGIVRIKNFSNNNYLHIQNGPVTCSKIDFEWWSAQWEIFPVAGTNYCQIRNRWKNNFISTDNGSFISDNGRSAKAMWVLEEAGTGGTYYIRNADDNSKLVFQGGRLMAAGGFNAGTNAQWIIEKM